MSAKDTIPGRTLRVQQSLLRVKTDTGSDGKTRFGAGHKHVYNIPKETRVPLRGKVGMAGYDILAQWACECGRAQTYDIKERNAR